MSTHPQPLSARQTAFAFAGLPGSLKPMLPSPAFEPFDSPRWIFEPLRGGLRTIAYFSQGATRLQIGEDGKLAEAFPEICDALSEAVSIDGVVLDGELVARDRHGTPKLSLILNRLKQGGLGHSKAPLTFHVWDILYHGYRSVLDKPLARRKELLLNTVHATEFVQPTLTRETDGIAFYEAAVSLGMEGVIAKHRDSLYVPGRRSRQWIAVRERRSADLVIGGYTMASGKARKGFESLLVGAYDGKKLRYLGAVPGGFDAKSRAELSSYLPKLQAESCPFIKAPHIGKLLYWCKPRLVAQVMFGEFGEDGQLLFPKFAGMRHDLPAEACTLAAIPGAIAARATRRKQ